MKKLKVIALVLVLMLSNSLTAVKLKVDGFAGFDDPPLKKTPTWHIKVFPDNPKDRKCHTYSDIEIIVFSSSLLPSRRFIKDTEIPPRKIH